MATLFTKSGPIDETQPSGTHRLAGRTGAAALGLAVMLAGFPALAGVTFEPDKAERACERFEAQYEFAEPYRPDETYHDARQLAAKGEAACEKGNYVKGASTLYDALMAIYIKPDPNV